MLSGLELTGRTDAHVVAWSAGGCRVHREVVEPLRRLHTAAAAEGIDLVPCSAFRDFDGQLRIWNSKFRGERPLFDRNGHELEYSALDPAALIEAILGWSALPGASRHHWGTDLDLIDRAALPEGYRPQLLPAEYAAGGVFESLGRWLDAHLAEFGFFRPFRTRRGGVNPEPWHVSYAALAGPALEGLSIELLAEAVDDPRLEGRKQVLDALAEIHRRYVLNVDPP